MALNTYHMHPRAFFTLKQSPNRYFNSNHQSILVSDLFRVFESYRESYSSKHDYDLNTWMNCVSV